MASDDNRWKLFRGGEEQLLRAQIARITSTCTLAPKGWFEARCSQALCILVAARSHAAYRYPI